MLADLRGIEFDWFAADSEGNVALFATAGEGFLPAGVAENHEMHSAFAESLPAPRVGTAEVWLDYADAGFYVFDWALPGGPYELRASPNCELKSAIKQQALAVMHMPRFNGSFSSTTKVDSWK
ncbi:hypothetical protein [Roseateles cavernae]|uniref:hypothetical protein n=1 Tax=Roseateles cavernae TaxID=3153578 RepID=UPI0032E4548B